ncbi:MAG: nitronate monooxygenase [Chloroflexota bacterium]|nr:nitronate monooxygenase [Chloroflexota bacterium]
MLTTELCSIVGIRYPIIQAGMGPWSTSRLCAAVANAGGLGIISTSGLAMGMMAPQAMEWLVGPGETGTPYEVIKRILYRTKDATSDDKGIFGINCPLAVEWGESRNQIVQAAIDVRNEDSEMRDRFRVIITSAGNPAPWAETIKASGAKWFHVVPSVYHAKKCEQAGVDAVIASGHEGGMHISWEPVHSMVLLPAVVKAVQVPVIGTGGFSDGATLAAALALGAVGVQMGTRFIATKESDFVDSWKQQILQKGERDTMVARGIAGPARYLRNSAAVELADITVKKSPNLYLGQADDLTTLDPEIMAKEMESWTGVIEGGREDEKVLWAGGEVAGRIEDLPTVEELIERTCQEAENIILALPKNVE